MKNYSTRQAAKQLGISHAALARYVEAGKVPSPQMVSTGMTTTHIWSEEDIERVRELLPKIANGRKTRYKKKKSTISKTKKNDKKPAQPRAAVPHEQSKQKKSKP